MIYWFISIYFLIIFIHIPICIYNKMSWREKLDKNYLLISEMVKFKKSFLPKKHTYYEPYNTIFYYRWDIYFRGFFRFLFNKPVKFEKIYKQVQDGLQDLNGIDSMKFFKLKKNNKL